MSDVPPGNSPNRDRTQWKKRPMRHHAAGDSTQPAGGRGGERLGASLHDADRTVLLSLDFQQSAREIGSCEEGMLLSAPVVIESCGVLI